MKLELGFLRLCRDGLSPLGLNRRENKNSIFIREQEGGQWEKKDPLRLQHTWFSQPSFLRLGFVPAPTPAGRAETMRSRFSRRHLSPFSARAWVQKGYFKIKPCLLRSDETWGELSSGSCSLPSPETFHHSASGTCSFTPAKEVPFTFIPFIRQPRRAATKSEGETTRKKGRDSCFYCCFNSCIPLRPGTDI